MPPEMARNPLFVRPASALFALFVCLCLAFAAGTVQAQELALTQADTADDKGQGHFPAEATTRTIGLPDDWARSRPQVHSPLWYRLRFDGAALATMAGPLGLFIERACANVEIQINGLKVAQGRFILDVPAKA